MQGSFLSETELPGKSIDADTLRIIAHRYYWASGFVSGNNVLEVGCGPGLGLGWLSSGAKRVIGGDIVPEGLALANNHYKGRRIGFIRMDAHNLPFKDLSFDIVICVAAAIYIDLPVFLNGCHRILKQGGLLIMNTPNKDIPGFRPSALSLKYYSVPELKSLLDRNRFTVEFFGSFAASQGVARVGTKALSLSRGAAGKLAKAIMLDKPLRKIKGLSLPQELGISSMDKVRNIVQKPIEDNLINRRYRIISLVAQKT